MIEAIACIGNQGQLGLNGKLPWGRDAAPGDLQWFRAMTLDADVCIVGVETAKTLPKLDGRELLTWSSRNTRLNPLEYLNTFGVEYDLARVMVIGGAKTYRDWMPYIKRWHIGRADYDGIADVWMPPLWEDNGDG